MVVIAIERKMSRERKRKHKTNQKQHTGNEIIM